MSGPEPTSVTPSIQLRIADDLRIKIQRGVLQPGDDIPSAQELSRQWDCSPGSARAALSLLKKQGLVISHRGSRPKVRIPPRQALIRQETIQLEKERVHLSDDERRENGAAEDTLGVPLDQLDFLTPKFDKVAATRELASWFKVSEGTELLRREYATKNKKTGTLEQWSVSYIPTQLIEQNPRLFDPTEEPWPGGTQHQLYTVGIEIARMESEITATMPTTVEVQQWDLPDGVPLLLGRRTAIDTQGRIVEVSEAKYPADRTRFLFAIDLKPWKDVQ